jgi:hypothetical protein
MTSIPTDGKANPEMNFINAILSAAYHDTLAENGAKYLADDELEQIFPNLQFDN